MKISASINIYSSKENIWKTITDFKNSTKNISAITAVEILNEPKETLIGFKWKETRVFLGKKATETMWITDFETNHYYVTKAENHGSIYISTLKINPQEKHCTLTMSFEGIPQTLSAKIMGFIFLPLFKNATLKAFQQDLEDLKKRIETL